MVEIDHPSTEVWTRCGVAPIEIHHRVTRARGGEILDAVGETYHLLALCRAHHSKAHDDDRAFDNGLLLAGSVIAGTSGPNYSGPDKYLNRKYGS